MKDQALIQAVRAGLAARANPEIASGMQGYMKSAMPFYGVQKPARDLLARELLGRDHDPLAAVLRDWARDPEMWKRRAAIVSQVRRKAATDLTLLYDCIEPSRGDAEFFIRKGIGWALRSYAWADPDEIVRYCAAHELSPLSRREALRNVVTEA